MFTVALLCIDISITFRRCLQHAKAYLSATSTRNSVQLNAAITSLAAPLF